VNNSGSRLYVSRAQAASLLNAQIRTGEELRRAVARATALAELQMLKRQLSAWSTRSERVLGRVFGEAERLAYRQASPSAVRVRSFEDQQIHVEQRTDSRLQYLRGAAARIGSADEMTHSTINDSDAKRTSRDTPRQTVHVTAGHKQPQRKVWWRAALTNPWTIAVVAPLIVTAVLAASHIGHSGSMITGSVVCQSGRPIVGVWIAASTGQGDSDYAHLGPLNLTDSSSPIGSEGTYSYRLPQGGTYSVHVGCGGTSAHWASNNYSPLLSSRTARLHCDDPTAASTNRAIPRGRCTAGPAS
jgi:hypothetical protein